MKKRRLKKSAIIISIIIFVSIIIGVVINTIAAPKFTLTGSVNKSENAINLSWNVNDNSTTWIYKIYQKKEGSSEWQTISTSNLNKQVKVLNLYPDTSHVTQTITYTTYDGTTRTLPKSASLEMWMEKPNSEDGKGYGKGLIQVDPLSLNDFNKNPSAYMKDSKGNWKYDVVMVGTWDNNGLHDTTNEGIKVLREFIRDGRGLLLGHDTIGFSVFNGPLYPTQTPNFRKLMRDMNLEEVPDKDKKEVNEISKKYQVWGSDEVVITRKGLFTEWPWKIGDVGTVLKIPYSHTGWVISKGDRWLKYRNIKPLNGTQLPNADYSMSNENPQMNGYLYSFGNTALIQTGHSNGEATPDEQKILANTLFYLSQLTTDTSLIDRSGMDVKGPTQPTVRSYNNSTQEVTLNPSADQGSSYSYYVIAEGKDNGVTKKSETITVTNTSGLAGYSYVVDNKPNTIPDKTVYTTKTTFKINATSGQYLHVMAIDKQGNTSNVTHYRLDKEPPNVSFSPNGNSTYKKSHSVKVTATDLNSGVDSLEYVWTNSSSITAPTNGWKSLISGTTLNTPSGKTGNYYLWVRAKDKSSNTTTVRSNAFRLDNTNPTFSVNPTNGGWKNTAYVVTPTYSDTGGSGLKSKLYAWSTSTKAPSSWSSYSSGKLTQPSTGIYYLHYKVEDHAGNITQGYVGPYYYESTKPSATLSYSPNTWTKGNVTILLTNISDSGGSGLKSIKKPDGSVISGVNKIQYLVKENGTYNFVLTDNAGNKNIISAKVSHIDRKRPIVEIKEKSRTSNKINVQLEYKD